MGRRQLLIILPVLAVLLMAGAFLLFVPDASPLSLLGDNRRQASSQIAPTPEDVTLDPAEKTEPDSATPDSPAGAFEEAMRAEAERIRAERARNPDPSGQIGKNEKDPTPSGPSQSGNAEKPAPTPPAQPPNPKQAERERRINQLRAIKRPPNQTLGNARPATRRIKDPIGKKNLDEVSKQLMQDRRGLYARYYAFTRSPLEDLLDPDKPTLDQRTPDVLRIDQRVYFESKADWSDLPIDLTNFMGVWEGFLVVQETGEYWLYAGSDWTMRVVIAGDTVLLNDIRDYTEVSTVITLEAGLHPLRIEYMEGKNGSVIDAMGACNFMYVPEGQSKPIPVPPEMLLLPEHLWSNNAPIITKLSKDEGEVGDGLTIHGQNLSGKSNVIGPSGGESKEFPDWVQVSIGGTFATLLEQSETQLKVTVPIGAITGKVIVYKAKTVGAFGSGPADGSMLQPTYGEPIPSNSQDYLVTTQFGLFAGWHNLEGWSNYGFIEPGTREPEVLRLERDFMFDQRANLDLPFKHNPLACRWDGKLGLPADWAADGPRLIRFQANGRLRVTLGDQARGSEGATGDVNSQTILDFEVPAGDERYLPLSIDFTAEGPGASLRITEMKHGTQANPDGSLMWEEVRVLPYQYFFPPVVPPKPPRILSAKAIYSEGETPPAVPFSNPSTLPSIREGQDFEFEVEVTGDAEVQGADLKMSVDGKAFSYTLESVVQVNAASQRRKCRAVLPVGLGEGRMVARLTIVTSDPFQIDVTNKGLIAYLFDLPNPGGYGKMPDLEPLMCFEVRKNPWVNYENANDFNLPFPAETFAVAWYGALIVEQEGDYIFHCRSDDGILVWLDGILVLEDDNLHYQRSKSSAPVRLAPGVYPFRMEFFENNVHEVCVLEWEAKHGENVVVPKQVIPKRHWTWDQHPPLPAKVGTGKRTDGSDPE